MITYFVNRFKFPSNVSPGDRFTLYTIKDGKRQQVCSREVTAVGVISHWAYMDIPGIGVSYFIGNEKLAGFLAKRFPDAEIEKNPKTT